MNIQVTYTDWKTLTDQGLPHYYTTNGDSYRIVSRDDTMFFQCDVDIDDVIDYETNYKPNANKATVTTTGINVLGGADFISNLKTYFSNSDTSLTSSHSDIYTKTGSGLIWGFSLEFDSNRVALRLEVDGQEVFDYKLKEEIEEFARFFSTTKSTGSRDDFFALSSSDRVLFRPPKPIRYSSEFKIQAKETSGNRKVDWIKVYYTEE